MKFKTKVDEVQYTILGLNEFEIRKRLRVLKDKNVGKDKEKSRDMKNRWRRDKHKLKKGIKKWHKSTKGKRFHRALGRFNALREEETVNENSAYIYYNWYLSSTKAKKDELKTLSIDQVTDALFGLSSINSHIMLELQYYEPDPEAMSEFLEIAHNFMKDSAYLNEKLLQSYETGVIQKDDFILLCEIFQFFLDPKAYLYIKRDLNGLRNDDTHDDEFKKQLEFVENVDVCSEDIFETIDEFFIKK